MRLGRYLIVGAALIAGGAGWLWQRTRSDLSRNENGGQVVQVRGFGELQDALATPSGLLAVEKEPGTASVNAVAVAKDGSRRWRCDGAEAILQPKASGQPLLALFRTGSQVSLRRLDADTGESTGVLKFEAATSVDGLWRSWFSDGQSLFFIESPQSAAGRLTRVDLATGAIRWQVTSSEYLDVDGGSLPHRPALALSDSLFVFCKEKWNDFPTTLCRFAVVDGTLQGRIPEVIDVASEATQEALFVLRKETVQALRMDGSVLWTRALPGLQGRSVALAGSWVAVIARPDDHSSYIGALDAHTGALLWERRTDGGVTTTSDNAARLGYLSVRYNANPAIRVYNQAGAEVAGYDLPTRFVITTEFAGGFSESLLGELVLAPPYLLYTRAGRGLMIHTLP